MSRTFSQIPPDSTGDKLSMRRYTVGADDLHSQGIHLDGLPSYRAVSADITPANSKWHTYLLNNAASGQSVIILGVKLVPVGVTGVTGVVNRFDIRLGTGAAPTGGAAITPVRMNTADLALANVTAYGGATGGVADGSILESMVVSSEENTAAVGNIDRLLQHYPYLRAPRDGWGRPLILRPGEGMGVKQNGAGTVGTFQWIIDFAVEID